MPLLADVAGGQPEHAAAVRSRIGGGAVEGERQATAAVPPLAPGLPGPRIAGGQLHRPATAASLRAAGRRQAGPQERARAVALDLEDADVLAGEPDAGEGPPAAA